MKQFEPLFLGNYILVETLDSGGMGQVYLGFRKNDDGKLAGPFAIKMVTEDISKNVLIKHFEQEAQLFANLRHDGIPHFIEFVKDSNRAGIVMELVRGVNLSTLQSQKEKSFLIDLSGAIYIALRLAEILDYLHQRQSATGTIKAIIHGDVTPQNVLMTFAGEVMLVDFGISRLDLENRTDLLQSNLANVWYASPNRVRTGLVSTSDDIFGFGIILWELVTGQRYYQDMSQEKVIESLKDFTSRDPRKVRPNLPEDVVQLVHACLNSESLNGMTSTEDLVEAVRRLTSNHAKQFSPNSLGAQVKAAFALEINANESREAQHLKNLTTVEKVTAPPVPAIADSVSAIASALSSVTVAPAPVIPKVSSAPVLQSNASAITIAKPQPSAKKEDVEEVQAEILHIKEVSRTKTWIAGAILSALAVAFVHFHLFDRSLKTYQALMTTSNPLKNALPALDSFPALKNLQMTAAAAPPTTVEKTTRPLGPVAADNPSGSAFSANTSGNTGLSSASANTRQPTQTAETPHDVTLTVASDPPGADVLFNGALIGRTPMNVRRPASAGSIEIAKPPMKSILIILDKNIESISANLNTGEYDVSESSKAK